jgi:2-polyprenyl-3-methyl-5-hydroxy-6-metoxy-1,4-benzoquinol methylase
MRAFYARDYRLDYKRTYQPRPHHVYRAGKVAVHRFMRLHPLLRPGARVLDVGAGGGEVVYVLRAMGFDASGFEPNEGYARYAAERLGAPVAQGFWQDAAVDRGSQDLVTMFHTMEHLEDPLGAMRRAHDWLGPQGTLFVEVPNVEATYNQPHQQFHRGHLHHFNMAVLQMMGRRAGYTVIEESTSGDGGIISVVFRKADGPPIESGAIPGNYERVASRLRRHTTVSHLFSRYPYVRPLQKLRARFEEQRGVWPRRPPREVLDRLIARHLNQGGPLRPGRTSGV